MSEIFRAENGAEFVYHADLSGTVIVRGVSNGVRIAFADLKEFLAAVDDGEAIEARTIRETLASLGYADEIRRVGIYETIRSMHARATR